MGEKFNPEIEFSSLNNEELNTIDKAKELNVKYIFVRGDSH